jgi:tRNA/rRNA methyltransferase
VPESTPLIIAPQQNPPVPVIAGTGVSIGEIVRACHAGSIDDGLAQLAITGLDRDTLEPVLQYCAELRCIADGATCALCKRRTEAQGIETFDQFVLSKKEIIIGDGSIRLTGNGTETIKAPDLESLAKYWSGDNTWFWARRVIRKLRHGLRRANMPGEAVAEVGETPSVLLMEPQLADNIGMVARAMANFGLDDLRLIAPRDGWPNEKARIAASGANYVIDDASAHVSLDTALGDLNWVCATTARQRDLRKPVMTPLDAIAEMKKRIGEGQRCGILFGRERSGLETSEVAYADALVMIPVNSQFASLNLAQAVLILGYEWMRTNDKASLGRVTTFEKPVLAGLNLGHDRLATKEEQIGLFEHLEWALDEASFFNPKAKREGVIRNLRAMFTRTGLTEQEVRTLRGIVATLARGKRRTSN